MSKTKSFLKYFKNINNSINSLLEKNLNKLNFKNLSNLFKNNKLILIFVAVFVLFVSYLLIPTFYNQTDISTHNPNPFHNPMTHHLFCIYLIHKDNNDMVSSHHQNHLSWPFFLFLLPFQS